MMRYVIELWLAFVPLALYAGYMVARRRAARKRGEVVPKFSHGPWPVAVFTCVGAALVLLIWFGATADRVQGSYVPATLENGVLKPGRIVPDAP